MPAEAAVIDAYRQTATTIRARTLTYLDAAWRDVELDLRDETVARFGARASAVTDAAQGRIAVATDAYLAQHETAVLGTPLKPLGADAGSVSTSALRGVPADEVWARPGQAVWSSLSRDASVPRALAQGLTRAHEMAETNLQLAHTHTARNLFARRTAVQGHQRVPRGAKSCALCLLASTQRYHRADLQPMHANCHCVVRPIYSDGPVAQVLNRDQADAVHAAVRAATGTDNPAGDAYRDYVLVHEHGEIGPVLTVRGQSFTGPTDLVLAP